MSTDKQEGIGIEIKDERDYAIRKGRVLERFRQEFFTRHAHDALFRRVWESLIRDADPYWIIEQLIEINSNVYKQLDEVMPFVPPSFNNQTKKT